ncbi:MAG: 4-(cytidine 5'-diphospho)-2-C-methyl-D-erythritol kinase [Verrucomicrobia bacterium]|nr:4-(cytidine 5'-diphospho)-2-C-methyl-D-erythritol kinase [Verrucomicrobiota bacterium]
MPLERNSPCKVNFLLNILGKRADGFHELETVMHPIALFDTLSFERKNGSAVELTCSEPSLPIDSTNLVHRAATAFLNAAQIRGGVRIHLEKRIPVAAGLGGGSSNAAQTLLGLGELFGNPLPPGELSRIGASLGSDVPFFLQSGPALATGRGESIASLPPLAALRGAFVLLVFPGFGISTAWAYQQLARFPAVLNGERGRAQKLVSLLQGAELSAAAPAFYNALETPALSKYPILSLYQEFMCENGALVSRMSGSGSATFGILPNEAFVRQLEERFRSKFGDACWTTVASLGALDPSPSRWSGASPRL